MTLINGYRYFYDPQHPMANVAGIVYEHRAVMFEHLGRVLRSDECVHHIDGDKLNNDPANLVVWLSQVHSMRHHVGEEVSVRCARCGKWFLRSPSGFENARYCSNVCRGASQRRVAHPSKQTLKEEMASNSWVALGRKYGVSDNAVRKWAKRYGLL
jgi:hypothetical protein